MVRITTPVYFRRMYRDDLDCVSARFPLTPALREHVRWRNAPAHHDAVGPELAGAAELAGGHHLSAALLLLGAFGRTIAGFRFLAALCSVHQTVDQSWGGRDCVGALSLFSSGPSKESGRRKEPTTETAKTNMTAEILPLLADAATGLTGNVGNTLPLAFAGAGAGIGVGLVGAKAAEAVGRNPGAFGNILVIGIIGMALAEAIAIYALIIAFRG